MHGRAAVGDREGQDRSEIGVRIGEQVFGKQFNGLRTGPLGDPDRDHFRAERQYVAAFEAERHFIAVIGPDFSRQIRMVREDIFSVDRFPLPRLGVHAVNADAVSDAGKRISCKVKVRHRRNDEPFRRLGHVGKGPPGYRKEFRMGDAFHGFPDQFLFVGDGPVVFSQFVFISLRCCTGHGDEFADKLFADIRGYGDGFGSQVFKVKHPDAVVSQQLRECVMLRPGLMQERDIVKQQLRHGPGTEMFQFPARTVQHDGF